MIYSVIDIGSNTIRMSVFKVVGKEAISLFSEKDQASLRNYLSNGKLRKKGIKRLISVLEKFKYIADNFDDIDTVFPFATVTIRDSSNRDEILKKVKKEVGFDIEILSEDDESRLTFVGASKSIDVSSGVLTDIGGGSSEIVVFKDKEIIESTSLKIGSLSAFEDFVGDLIVKDSERKAIDKDVKDKLEVSKIKKKDYDTLCADGGSARATLDLYNEFYDLNSSNAFMKRDKLKDMLDDILGMDSRNTLHKFYNYFKETIFYLYIIFKEVDL
ncbi:hypothetical protein PN298_00575 [Peptostreptococcus anaerobius]|nr:hypothetical protein [Peptostreptococcus anaerobius]MDB8849251.1 hypothetical protein [Peptostreptococcus anaerobius]MDB8852863.1 hypothetical protein [Peptostreptococcus anaerobius]